MADLFVGENVDPAKHERTGTKVALPSGDFTTHGVIVGMTGSGKTGLGVVLIEEALSAGIPTLLIDPKGDLTNLCLSFPGLSPVEFQPWVNEGDAAKAGLTVADFAAQQAAAWTAGLAGWGLGPERITALRNTVDFTIYTPGSTAGVSMNLVGSLQAPTDISDVETIRDEIEGYVSGLLGLVGIEADPLASREHILLSNLIETAWSGGKSIDLPTLVGQVATPPIRKLGVFELDAFFPPKDRMGFAMKLNGLLASPAFSAWAKGEPLDIDTLLRTPDGKPRCAIITTAHLSDQERQFVTSLVLSKLVTWMRKQSGTTDLRALLYMDEVAGYLPPTAMPPTKKPIMTLLKQARAFGVGVVLSTQNPVDVDYKALSNAGTWMIGRLQTERDKDRLLDGMSAASGGVDIAAVSATISGLAKREFVLRRAGKDKPEVFTTRWAMSYLRGPLTRDQIESLMASRHELAAVPSPSPSAAPSGASAQAPAAPPTAPVADDATTVMPEIAGGVGVRFADVASPWLATVGGDAHGQTLAAAIAARVRLRYDDDKADLMHDGEYEAILFPLGAQVDATRAIAVDYDDRDLREQPTIQSPHYRLPDGAVKDKAFWTKVERDLIDHLVRVQTLEISVNRELKLFSRPGETAEAFTDRCMLAADEAADGDAAKLKDRYEAKLDAIETKVRDAEGRLSVLQQERHGKRSDEVLGGLGSVLGGLFGGRRGGIGGLLRGAASRRNRSSTADERVDVAQDKVNALHEDTLLLEGELTDELTRIQVDWQSRAREITTSQVTLERADVSVAQLVLVWLPVA